MRLDTNTAATHSERSWDESGLRKTASSYKCDGNASRHNNNLGKNTQLVPNFQIKMHFYFSSIHPESSIKLHSFKGSDGFVSNPLSFSHETEVRHANQMAMSWPSLSPLANPHRLPHAAERHRTFRFLLELAERVWPLFWNRSCANVSILQLLLHRLAEITRVVPSAVVLSGPLWKSRAVHERMNGRHTLGRPPTLFRNTEY